MATIATLTVKDDGFEGTLTTLNVTAQIAILPNAKNKDSEPDFRVVSRKNGFELGAAWKRVSQSTGTEYVSVSLSAPEFGTIYGDWASTGLKGWKSKLHEFAIRPIQQFSYSSGKNATDIALVIDAMELLYTQKLDAFCIASSDADFTPLVMQLRANGHDVYGFGEGASARRPVVPPNARHPLTLATTM